jgi:nitrous oxide reductase accessory protein NosL
MKSSFKVMLAAVVVTLALAACKKPEEQKPTAPAEPQAQNSVTESASGTSTTFAPPAPEPQGAPPAAEEPKPAQ